MTGQREKGADEMVKDYPTKYLGIYRQAYYADDYAELLDTRWWIIDDHGDEMYFAEKRPTDKDIEEYADDLIG